METAALILPPLVTLIVAALSRQIVLALLIGCLLAALFAVDLSFINAVLLFGKRLLETTQLNQWTSWEGILDAPNPQISLFVILMGILIHTIEWTGGFTAFHATLSHFIHRKQQAESAAVCLSHFVAIDGYLAALTVGSVMRPLVDQYASTRIKLAYIARSMAIPLCSLNPFSTWMALLLLQISISGIHPNDETATHVIADPFHVYFGILPYTFYSLLTVFVIWQVVSLQISFGSMALYEQNPQLINRKNLLLPSGLAKRYQPRLLDFFLPILLLIAGTFMGFLYTGGYFSQSISLLEAMERISVAPALLGASAFATIIYFIYMTLRGAITPREYLLVSKEGMIMMLPSVALLNLAWTFGHLQTHDNLLGDALGNMLPSELQKSYMPFIFFLLSLFTATATGSSWATIAMLFPVATATLVRISGESFPIPLQELPELLPTFGAVLSGAVCGDQLSPISDTSIVASASAQCSHADHVHSQMSYSVPVIIASALAYILAGFLAPFSLTLSWVLPLIASTACCCLYFTLHPRYQALSVQ